MTELQRCICTHILCDQYITLSLDRQLLLLKRDFAKRVELKKELFNSP